jgi:hypothetical protein
MQQTLTPRVSPLAKLFEAIVQFFTAPRTPDPHVYARDTVVTDQMEREFAEREFRRWH